jgi:hypothetical protein
MFAPGRRLWRALTGITTVRFEKFRRVELVDRAPGGAGLEVDLRHADELVEASHDSRVATARAELGNVANQAEPDKEHEKCAGADD